MPQNRDLTTVKQGQDIRKDPTGIMERDLRHLRQVFPRVGYSPKKTDREIMFEEGKQHVIDYIERTFLK